jgi:hypothetical protein
MLLQLLDAIADSINPGLALLALLFPWIHREAFAAWRSRGAFWLGTALGLVVVYGIQFADNRLRLWPYFGLDYSTHTAFAVAMVTSIGTVSRRWLWPLTAILAAYAGLMMYLGYHSLVDILTAALAVAPPTALIHRLLRNHWRVKSEDESVR